MYHRRLFLVSGVALASVGGIFSSPSVVFAKHSIDLTAALAARVVGNPDAKIKLVEYFSLTCPHCARFHHEIFPILKRKYIDTGILQLEFRDFPLDQWALRAAALSRCIPSKHYPAFLDVLMKQQKSWTASKDIFASLVRIGKLAGYKQEFIKSCMSNEKLLDGIIRIRLEGEKKYKVRTTPSFLLNGEKIDAYNFDEFESLISKLIR